MDLPVDDFTRSALGNMSECVAYPDADSDVVLVFDHPRQGRWQLDCTYVAGGRGQVMANLRAQGRHVLAGPQPDAAAIEKLVDNAVEQAGLTLDEADGSPRDIDFARKIVAHIEACGYRIVRAPWKP